MRIAIVTYTVGRNDGQGRVNYEIIRHLRGARHEVHVIAARMDPELQSMGVTWHPTRVRFTRPSVLKVWDFVRQADEFVSRLRSRVDVIVANGYSLRQAHHVNISNMVHSAHYAALTKRCHGSRSTKALYRWTDAKFNMAWERTAYAAAERVVAVSNRVKKDLEAIGVNSGRISTILNGVDLDEFKPGEVDRQELGLPEGVPLALFVGDIRTNGKNLDTVLKALASMPHIHLAVVGSTRGSAYPEIVRNSELKARVRFLGFRQDVSSIMRACDLLVFPSRYDAFGLVVLEAMATALPVVTSATVGASQLVTSECGVVLEDANDASALALAIGKILADSSRTRSMGCSARGIAERYSWSRMASDYLTLFERCVTYPAETAPASDWRDGDTTARKCVRC